MSELLEKGFEACAAGLREFGYPDVTAEKVRKAHENWKSGEYYADVIEAFAFSEFDENPGIFGEKS